MHLLPSNIWKFVIWKTFPWSQEFQKNEGWLYMYNLWRQQILKSGSYKTIYGWLKSLLYQKKDERYLLFHMTMTTNFWSVLTWHGYIARLCQDIQTSIAMSWKVHLDRKAVCAKALWKAIQAFNVPHLLLNKNSSDEEKCHDQRIKNMLPI